MQGDDDLGGTGAGVALAGGARLRAQPAAVRRAQREREPRGRRPPERGGPGRGGAARLGTAIRFHG